MHVMPRFLVVFEALIPLALRGTKIAKYIKNQTGPDRFPIISAQSLFPVNQSIQKKRVALFKLALRKKCPPQIGFIRPGDVVAEISADP
jgi:hypothetical protein